jgi:phosphatidylethanolamine-binding protein (PEBP) family uncharacterized protein
LVMHHINVGDDAMTRVLLRVRNDKTEAEYVGITPITTQDVTLHRLYRRIAAMNALLSPIDDDSRVFGISTCRIEDEERSFHDGKQI